MLHPKIMACLAGLTLWLMAAPSAEAQIWNFTRIAPAQGPWGTKVRLYGYGFDKTKVKVYYDGQLVTPKVITGRMILVQVPDNTRSGWFEIEMSGRQLRAPVLFKVKNTPKVLDMQPRSGPPGIWVTIKGQFLPRGMRFWIGRSPVRKRQIDASTYKILIHNGLKGGVLYYAFERQKRRSRWRFKPAKYPVLAGFTPKKGYYGDRVTLNGFSFCASAKAYLGGTELKVVRRARDRSLVVELPKGVATGQFEVECYGKRVSNDTEFLVEPPFAEVTGISPTAGKAGRWITVIGMGFTRKDRFWMGNRLLRKKYRSGRQVQVFIPAGAPNAPLYFETFGKRFKSSFAYTVYRPPVITGFSPVAAWYGGYVTLRGRNFCPMIQVRLGDQALPVVQREDNTSVTVQVPKGAQPAKFSVQCLNWKKTYFRKLRIEAPKAGVRRVKPTIAPPGSRVEIQGFNLRPSDRFYLGNLRLPMAFESRTRVSVTLPRKPMTAILVHETFGRKVQTRFRIKVGWPKPTLVEMEPNVAWYNEVVTLKGSQICDAPIVRLGRRPVPVVNSTAKTIQVTVPRGSKGGVFLVQCHNYKVKVPGRLKIEAPFARITSIFPTRGPYGTWITLTGKNFKERDRFWLGRKPFTEVRRISANEVRVKVPQGAAGGKITVLSRGRRTVTNHRFTLAFPVPSVASVKPGQGWWGDLVIIRGRNFCPKPVIRFGRRVAFDFTWESKTRIKVRVPKRVYSGAVEVRCYGKAGRWAGSFRVVKPQPRVVDMYPDRGPPKRWLNVSGHNLDRVQKAWLMHRRFGKVELVVKQVSKTRIQVFVPAGCKGGALVVQAYNQAKTTSFAYFVPRKYR